jgi:hypothetical protein
MTVLRVSSMRRSARAMVALSITRWSYVLRAVTRPFPHDADI